MKQISQSILQKEYTDHLTGYLRAEDESYAARICRTAKAIYDSRREKPVVLLSGPSGSGKTTSARMLEAFLDSWGCETHTISMDDYFSTMSPEEILLRDAGKLDLESPNRMDTGLLNEHILKMIAGEPVELPEYDFVNSAQRLSGKILTRKPGELVIFEGIHALNPSVITVPDSATNRLYVSVRTRIEHEGKLLHPEKIRLLRRMLRDRVGRGRSPADTLAMYDRVQEGENKYIMPYKHRCSFDIDTFIGYEPGVYRAMLWEELEKLREDERVAEIAEILESMPPVPPEAVSAKSLIQEFIG